MLLQEDLEIEEVLIEEELPLVEVAPPLLAIEPRLQSLPQLLLDLMMAAITFGRSSIKTTRLGEVAMLEEAEG